MGVSQSFGAARGIGNLLVGFVAAKSLDLLFVSIVTFAEIRFGIALVSSGQPVIGWALTRV